MVTVHMYKGRGEYRLARIANAPRMLPELGRSVGRCFASGTGVRQPAPDVGPEPPGPPLRASLAEAMRTHEQLGYRALGAQQRGALRKRETARRSLRLAGGRCYAVVARGGRHAFDVDMLVRAPGMRPIARDASRARDARVRFCPRSGGTHVVEVRMYEGFGDWALQAFVLDEPPPEQRPAGLEGQARIPWAELRARMRRRGMRVSPVAWGQIAPRRSLSMPVRLEAGRCYAFGGVPSEALMQGDLDLVLVDESGALRAWDLGQQGAPLMFHCAKTSGVYRVIGKSYGARGAYLVLQGRDGPTGGAP